MPNSSNSWNYGRRLATFDAYNWANIANYIPQRGYNPPTKTLVFLRKYCRRVEKKNHVFLMGRENEIHGTENAKT